MYRLILFFVFALFSTLVYGQVNVSVCKYYTNLDCDRTGEITLKYNGNAAYQIEIHITYDTDLVDDFATDDFTNVVYGPDANGIIIRKTDALTVYADLIKEATFEGVFNYKIVTPEVDWEVINVNNSNVVNSGTITFPGFKTIDGTGPNGTTVTDEIMDDNLLSANDALSTEQYIVIDGVLKVDQHYSFNSTINGGSQIVMKEGAEIVVENQKLLSIDNSQIYGCEKLWKSITVDPGELRISRSRIEDGAYAIDVQEHYSGNITGLRLHLNEFINNYISINGEAPSTSTEPRQSVNAYAIRGCTFKGDGNMLSAYSGMPDAPGSYPYCAINVEKWPFFQLSVGFPPTFAIATNEFNNLENGIILKDSDLGVYTAEFEDIENNATGTAIRAVGGSLDLD